MSYRFANVRTVPLLKLCSKGDEASVPAAKHGAVGPMLGSVSHLLCLRVEGGEASGAGSRGPTVARRPRTRYAVYFPDRVPESLPKLAARSYKQELPISPARWTGTWTTPLVGRTRKLSYFRRAIE
jgi:hypothetical protein